MTPTEKLETWRQSNRGLPERHWKIIGPDRHNLFQVELSEDGRLAPASSVGMTDNEAADNAIKMFGDPKTLWLTRK